MHARDRDQLPDGELSRRESHLLGKSRGVAAVNQSVRLAVSAQRHTLGECEQRKLQKSKKNLALVSGFATFTPLLKAGIDC
jgi:hypothetical protein